MSGHRRSVRLPGHPYAGGLYFVTICASGHEPVFGAVVGDEVCLSSSGRFARDEWIVTLQRPGLVADAFVVMPDHVHLLFGIVPPDDWADEVPSIGAPWSDEGTARRAPTPLGAGCQRQFAVPGRGTLPTVVRAYKSAVTRAVNRLRATPGAPVWQRGYHDRVVRSDREAEHVRRYILENPARAARRLGSRPERPNDHP